MENIAEVTSPGNNDEIEKDAVASDSATMETEEDDPDLGKEGQPLVKLPESAVKTGPALVKSAPVVTTTTATQASVFTTTTVTTATETMATASRGSPPVVVSSTAGTRALQGTSLVRGVPGVPVHHVTPVPVQAPPGAMFPAAMSPVMPHLSHQMASRHAAIAAAAASAAVTAMKMHATGGQHPRLQPPAAAPTVNLRTITGQSVIRAGTAPVAIPQASARSLSPGHAAGTPLVRRHAALMSAPDTAMVPPGSGAHPRPLHGAAHLPHHPLAPPLQRRPPDGAVPRHLHPVTRRHCDVNTPREAPGLRRLLPAFLQGARLQPRMRQV